jgi:hypothetical protein
MRNLYIFFALLLCGSVGAQAQADSGTKGLVVQDDKAKMLDIGQASASSVTLQWTAPGDDSLSGTAAAYDIAYSTDSSLLVNNFASANHLANPPTPEIAGTTQAVFVTGLEEGLKYYFALKAVDEAGNWSGLSNIVAVETLDITPPAAVTDLEAM